MFLKKTECLASTYKSGSLRGKLPKMTMYTVGTQEFLALALAFWLDCLALPWILLSHIGKMTSLFLPYKVWTNEKEYH